MRKLVSADYRVSAWSGGTTTQLAIFPENAVYADRDFLWRVSSATVDLEESDFTPLPDYDRLIATLEGEIVLTHNGGEPLRLRPLEVHAFSGADATHSVGRCRDFNLMLRRGQATGTMEPLRLTDVSTRLDVGTAAEESGSKDQGSGIRVGSEFRVQSSESVGTSIACPQPFPAETVLLYCAEGSCTATVGAVIGRPSVPPVGAVIGRPGEESGSKDQRSGIRVGSEFRVQSSEPVGTSIACPPVSPVGAVIGRPAGAPACHSERSEAESKNPSPLSLHAGETLLLTGPADLTLTGPATLLLCRITVL